MTKAKTNALEALRALIAERQQYEQWISTLESKREGTPPHVFERVHADYSNRLQRVMGDIKGHAEELQLSISALSSRLVEVSREEDTRRDALQEAELRAMVGEYEPAQWEQLRNEGERALEKIAADRAGLDNQLAELRGIQRLSEVGSVGDVGDVAVASPVAQQYTPAAEPASQSASAARSADRPAAAPSTDGEGRPIPDRPPSQPAAANAPAQESRVGSEVSRDQGHLPLEQAAAASAAVLSAPVSSPPAQPAQSQPKPVTPSTAQSSQQPTSSSAPTPARPRPVTGKTPPFGAAVQKAKPPEPRIDQSKTLKCPECGTPNYPTEWYCERCGGELATM